MAKEYKHGSMDITAQEQTFEGFVRFVSWAVVLIVLFLIFLAMFNS
jgi:hypothetical protein